VSGFPTPFYKQIERMYAPLNLPLDQQPEPKYGFWLGDLAHWFHAGWMERLPNGYDPTDLQWPMNLPRRAGVTD
jgi:hypothetical protein